MALLSLVGIIFGHYLTYWVMAPGAHARQDLLEVTGHGPWTLPAYLVTAMFVAGIFALVTNRMSGRSGWAMRTALIAVQCVGFAGLEVAERSLAHGPSLGLLNDVALWLGIGFQILIAVIAPLLVRVVARSLCRIVGRFFNRTTATTGNVTWTSASTQRLSTALLRNTRWLRGPPLSLLPN